MSGIYPGINSIGVFRENSYASICSLNFPEKGNVYTVSGLDTEQTSASIAWIVTAAAFAYGTGGLCNIATVRDYTLTNGDNCLPYI
jgi:hypothetical protein